MIALVESGLLRCFENVYAHFKECVFQQVKKIVVHFFSVGLPISMVMNGCRSKEFQSCVNDYLTTYNDKAAFLSFKFIFKKNFPRQLLCLIKLPKRL